MVLWLVPIFHNIIFIDEILYRGKEWVFPTSRSGSVWQQDVGGLIISMEFAKLEENDVKKEGLVWSVALPISVYISSC
jgi:hypothetical protein